MCRSRLGFLLNELHDLFSSLHRFFGIIGDIQSDQHIGKAHHAQTDFAIGQGDVLDLRQRIFVDINHIVQEVDGIPHHLFEVIVIDLTVANHVEQVDGAQIAGFIWQQRLLPTGIGGLDLSHVGSWVDAVDDVQKDDPGFTVFPGRLNDLVKDFARQIPA